jgi:hypothetical protein
MCQFFRERVENMGNFEQLFGKVADRGGLTIKTELLVREAIEFLPRSLNAKHCIYIAYSGLCSGRSLESVYRASY